MNLRGEEKVGGMGSLEGETWFLVCGTNVCCSEEEEESEEEDDTGMSNRGCWIGSACPRG